MKKISDFFLHSVDVPTGTLPVSKKTRLTDEITAEANATEETLMELSEPKPSDIVRGSSVTFEQLQSADVDWPTCWTLDQRNYFLVKYDWLSIRNKKLGCIPCRKVGNLGVEAKMGMKVSNEWADNKITYFGTDRQQQLMSLRKKLFDHKETAAHKAALKILTEAEAAPIENVLLKALTREKIVTAKIFRTAYKVAKENQSFHNFESEIDLQELNGVEMGRILHSTNACINVVNHISCEMRKKLFQEIVRSNNKISLIIDESTTLSQKSTLIVYIRVCLADSGMTSPVNLFLDLVELESVTANGVFASLLHCLHFYGLTEDFLRRNLVSLACDGAAVMLGSKSGVKALLKEKFPSVLVWHCANHRLELSVGDVVKQVSGINRFKAFIDKLYVVYHSSPKNCRELQVCARLLEAELLKIGRMLSTRWVASSFRSVLAVWEDYEVLVQHFEEAKLDSTRDKKDQCMYEGLQRKITSTEFVLDLGLMCDALQELSELSLDLQERNIDIYKADKKIKAVIQIFEERQIIPGPYYKIAATAVDSNLFKGVSLHTKNCTSDPPIDVKAFYKKLQESIEQRLLSSEDAELAYWARVLDTKQWPDNIGTHLTFGETEMRNLSTRLQLNERIMIRGFREYLIEKNIPDKLLPLQIALSTIPISSSEAERGFSQMNLIITPTRSSLMTTTVSSLLFIRLVGPPLVRFDPTRYVESWLLRGRHSATDTNSKERSREDTSDKKLIKLWNLL
ncbi:E3 SUMO-protein ligase [Biomphalaria pfeifferi]|uniref:E3 SUMO-protein ligase n=1 Tax=Biomphalaria pfeifferi TaxID=112525 RepID=A0AAD8B6T9_BIOPF|nr:E3 SUMO-protein ligase [Biomphalaria pfeifferi]